MSKKKVRRSSPLWKPRDSKQPRDSSMVAIWDERRNLIGYRHTLTGAIYTPQGNISSPAGDDQVGMMLILQGKKRPSKAFTQRIQSARAQDEAAK